MTAEGYLRSAIARLHAVHVLLFDLGQLDPATHLLRLRRQLG